MEWTRALSLKVHKHTHEHRPEQLLDSLHTNKPTRQADLLSEHCGVQVRDVPGVPSERALGVQREGDGDWDVDGPRVLQQEGNLGAGPSLAAGHHHALWRGGLVQTVLYRFILWHAEVQLVEAQQKGVPVLQEAPWQEHVYDLVYTHMCQLVHG